MITAAMTGSKVHAAVFLSVSNTLEIKKFYLKCIQCTLQLSPESLDLLRIYVWVLAV
jgi:hypothetical protein